MTQGTITSRACGNSIFWSLADRLGIFFLQLHLMLKHQNFVKKETVFYISIFNDISIYIYICTLIYYIIQAFVCAMMWVSIILLAMMYSMMWVSLIFFAKFQLLATNPHRIHVWIIFKSIKNWMGPNPNGPRSVSCDRAMRYSGFFGGP